MIDLTYLYWIAVIFSPFMFVGLYTLIKKIIRARVKEHV